MHKSIYGELLKEYESNSTKIGKKVYDILNEERIAGIILDDDIFWFESYINGNNCPDVVYTHIKKNLNKKGYMYIGDLCKKGI